MPVKKKKIVKASSHKDMAIIVHGELLTVALSKVPNFEDFIEQARLEIIENQDDLNPKMESMINTVSEIAIKTLRIKQRPTIH